MSDQMTDRPAYERQSMWTERDELWCQVRARYLEWFIEIGPYILLCIGCFLLFEYIGGDVISERASRLDTKDEIISVLFLVGAFGIAKVILEYVAIIVIAAIIWIALTFSGGKSNYLAFKIFANLSSEWRFSKHHHAEISEFVEKLFLRRMKRAEYGPALLTYYFRRHQEDGPAREVILRRAADTGFRAARFTLALFECNRLESEKDGRKEISELVREQYIPAILFNRYYEQNYDQEGLDNRQQLPTDSMLFCADTQHLLKHLEKADSDGFRFTKWSEIWLKSDRDLEWGWRRLHFHWDRCFELIADKLTVECLSFKQKNQRFLSTDQIVKLHRSAISAFNWSHRLSFAKHLMHGVGIKQNEGSAYAWLNCDTELLGGEAEELRREDVRSLSFDQRIHYADLASEWQRLGYDRRSVGRRRELEYLLGLSEAPVKRPIGNTWGAEGMLERIGHVLGWIGNLIGIAGVGLGYLSTDGVGQTVLIGGGVAAFLVGRALRYIFAGSLF